MRIKNEQQNHSLGKRTLSLYLLLSHLLVSCGHKDLFVYQAPTVQQSNTASLQDQETPYDVAMSAATKEQGVPEETKRPDLTKLLFQWDYNNIGKRILFPLTDKETRELRATNTEMNWRLLEKGAIHLQVSPDELQDLNLYRYPRLYPHVQTPHCVCPSFHPIPADAVVKNVVDWTILSNDKRLSIKEVIFRAGYNPEECNAKETRRQERYALRRLEQIRKALPANRAEQLIIPSDLLAKEGRARTRATAKAEKKAAAHESLPGSTVDDPTKEGPTRAESPANLSEVITPDNPYFVETASGIELVPAETPSTPAVTTPDNPYFVETASGIELAPNETPNTPNVVASDNPYFVETASGMELVPTETASTPVVTNPDNPYLIDPPAAPAENPYLTSDSLYLPTTSPTEPEQQPQESTSSL